MDYRLAIILDEVREIKEQIKTLQVDRRPEYYTLRQVAEAQGKSLRTIQRKISAGELECVNRNGQRVVHKDNI